MPNKLYVKEGLGMEGITMQEGKSRIPKILSTFFVIVLLLALFGFGVSRYVSNDADNEESLLPEVTVLPTSSRDTEPTDVPTEPTKQITPTKKITLSPTRRVTPTITQAAVSLKIQVLNGSGEQGVAGRVRTVLTSAGYTVSTTGNADAFTYEGVTIRIKNSKRQLLNQLKADLEESDYTVTQTVTTLPETSTVDAIVIVGS